MEALARALSDWTQLLGPAAVDGDTNAFRSPDPTRGVSRLMVNIFDGARPVADAQDLVANDAPPAALMRAIRGLTRRLMIRYAQLGAVATG